MRRGRDGALVGGPEVEQEAKEHDARAEGAEEGHVVAVEGVA